MTVLSLHDQVILITGAGRWPGPALALAFAQQGATVAANDLSPVLLDPLISAAQGLPGQVRTYVADATRGMPLRAMLEEVQDDLGQINVLVNNPRIQPDTLILDIDEWDWQRTVEMNLNGPFLITKMVARQMRELGQGVILNLVDTAPQIMAAPGRSAYAASQTGLLAFSQAAARELIAYNIRVHTLCPDIEVLHPSKPTEVLTIPTAEPRHPGEALTRLAVFLSSPAASHLAGQTFQVSRSQYLPQPDRHAQEQG
jgi:NAD(P)-dependent dehydrogenase (short-subunit alcohol dehydrogenase family)